jgi:hypothetical protein
MARALIRGQADSSEERLHARRLAAMLRLKAREIAG